ncbi:MAG TPA: helix-turn-helix domain-containing protein [Candidatus Dormibacteraeota bacterium]|nr:helix-turn-helix domain-containing protein [Candidatus Dormibacteraeota bacterium]
MEAEAKVKRRYQSPLRQGQARNTRTAIIEAAWRLFAEQGYVATSIDEIAGAAGVSRATVFTAVGGKPVLLKAAFDVAIVGDDEPVSLPERPSSIAIRAEPDPRVYLDRYAALVTEVGGRVAPIAEAVRGAAGADADARELWETHLAQRHQGAANVVSDILKKGARLRPELDPETAADVVWMLNDPGLYDHLVLRRRWPAERFQSWLADALRSQLLGS